MWSNGLLATESNPKETHFDSWQFLKSESCKNKVQNMFLRNSTLFYRIKAVSKGEESSDPCISAGFSRGKGYLNLYRPRQGENTFVSYIQGSMVKCVGEEAVYVQMYTYTNSCFCICWANIYRSLTALLHAFKMNIPVVWSFDDYPTVIVLTVWHRRQCYRHRRQRLQQMITWNHGVHPGKLTDGT